MPTIEPKIFKAYDIRGLSPGELTVEIAERVGRAVVEFTAAGVVVVGRDMRTTSSELAKAVIAGVLKSGADVVDIGLTSTPQFYYAVGAQFSGGGVGAGIMITASHNPKEYNGFKMVRGNLLPIGEGSGMAQIQELVIDGKFSDKPEGTVMEIDVRDEYVQAHIELVPRALIGKPTVVIDAGNGMAGHTLPALLDEYRLKAERLFFELDGTFPNHEANPVKIETLAALIAEVRKQNADLGVSFDGDADRVGFCDETGTPVRGDIMTALLAGEVLKEHPGAPVLYDVRSSWAVKEAIEAAGGTAVMCRVGHAFIKSKLRELDACFGGELSAHYYFQDFYGVESSDLAMLYVLRAMNKGKRKLSELVAPLLRYHHSGEINFTVKDKDALMKRVEKKFSNGAVSVSKIDGIRIEYGSWWFNVRASNTEPLVRLNLEAKTKEEMEKRIEELSEFINENPKS